MQLVETTVTSFSGAYTRRIWRSRNETVSNLPVCIFLDAELYLERVDVPEVLDTLQSDAGMPRLEFIFVSNESAEARHFDYTCSESYAGFIAEDVLPADRGGGNYICGLSLSGLAAAHIALRYPGLFRGALCQSGSFWWDNGRFVELVKQAGSLSTRFRLSVGDEETETGVSHPPTGLRQEICQVESVRHAADALREIGCSVEHRVYSGGHDPAKWNAELPDALRWLLAR